jgi:hypothetical protein
VAAIMGTTEILAEDAGDVFLSMDFALSIFSRTGFSRSLLGPGGSVKTGQAESVAAKPFPNGR